MSGHEAAFCLKGILRRVEQCTRSGAVPTLEYSYIIYLTRQKMLINYEQKIRINSKDFVRFNIKHLFAYTFGLWYTKLELRS